jgi:hypothetical protein
MFNQFTVKQLHNILNHYKEYHDIKGYQNMAKAKLVLEMEKYFFIDNDHLYTMDTPKEGGSAKNAGYIRRMEKENLNAKKNVKNIDRLKMKNPSKYMQQKYGKKPIQPSPAFLNRNLKKATKIKEVKKVTEPIPEYVPEPLFKDNEVVDYNVGKPKKKVTKVKKRTPTEVEEERKQIERQKELENKQKLLSELESLKKKVLECRKVMETENNKYHTNLEYLKPGNWSKFKRILEKDGRKNVNKDTIQEEIIAKNRSNLKKIKDKYPEVFQYMKTHKMNDNLNDMYKHINEQIKKL